MQRHEQCNKNGIMLPIKNKQVEEIFKNQLELSNIVKRLYRIKCEEIFENEAHELIQ